MPEDMTVMIVDGGARGHLLSTLYEEDPGVKKIVVAPGNGFVAHNRRKEVIVDKSGKLKDPASLLAAAQKHNVDFVDVAQDDALALGTVDLLKANGIEAFGASKLASQIEWDKEWSRDFMARHEIPSTEYRAFSLDNTRPAMQHIRSIYERDPEAVIYVKATGLCGGKGALRCTSADEANDNITRMGTFGKAGERFVIEKALKGEEFTYVGISDGRTIRYFKRPSQDNKRSHDFDEGEQTGGMGANSPALVAVPMIPEIEERIMDPAIAGLRGEDRPYTGVLYLGGMEVDGRPFVVEFNARFPDPEGQVILPGVKNYPELAFAAVQGRLHEIFPADDNLYRWCVVGASKGYPGYYENVKGKRIYGLEEAASLGGIKIYGAGIDVVDGRFYANGGRLFSIVAEGRNPIDAKQRAYHAMSYINIEGNNLHFRKDIGWRDVDRALRARN